MRDLIDFFGSELVFTEAMKQNWSQKSFSYINNGRPNYGIMLSVAGRIDYVDEEQTVSVEPGDLIFLPKDCRYRADFHIKTSGVIDYLVNFESAEGIKIGGGPRKIGKGTEYIGFFEQLAESSFGINKTKNYARGIFCLMMDEIAVKCMRSGKVNPVIEKAQMLLRDNADLSIEEIAKQCGVSESGLRKSFKDSIGVSPMKYRMDLKIEKSKQMIESTDTPINEIADLLGFYDAAYFCKIFRKKVGMTPKTYSCSKRL